MQTSFRKAEQQMRCFWKLEVPVDSEEALQSVELYLRTQFAKIREDYSDVVPSLWPLENDFLRLTKSSGGLFIFASTLVDYVGKENPVSRLKHIVSLISQGAAAGPSHWARNPFQVLDMLYTTIVSGIPSECLSNANLILAFYLLNRDTGSRDLHLLTVCNILGLEQHEAYSALRRLHSVLTLPSPNNAGRQPVQFLHASFSDFLKDSSRSQSYHIDMNKESLKIWRRCASITKLAPLISKSPISNCLRICCDQCDVK